MNHHRTGPNSRTYEGFLTYHCQRRDIEKAVELLEGRSEANLPLTEVVTSRLIYCHCSRQGDMVVARVKEAVLGNFFCIFTPQNRN